MMQIKIITIVIITLMIGFGAGFFLRPVISSIAPATVADAPAPEARGMQYFLAHIDEARRVLARCREGSMRGEECANAHQAVTEAEGRDRFKKFMGH